MKSLHDYRGEARAAHKRYNRAFNRYCDTHPGCTIGEAHDAAREQWEASYAARVAIPDDGDMNEQKWAQFREHLGPRIGVADDGRWMGDPLEEQRTVLFAFGAYGNTYVLAFGSLDDALEDAAGWLKKHAPGLLVSDEEMEEAYNEALAEIVEGGADPEDEETIQQARDDAETDLTYTESGYIRSWEWTIVGETLSREDLLRIARGS